LQFFYSPGSPFYTAFARGVPRSEVGRAHGMADILYVGTGIVFFALSWLFVRLCDRL